MIQELKDKIDLADAMNNRKAKEIFLKIAMMTEDKQADTLKLVKMMLEAK